MESLTPVQVDLLTVYDMCEDRDDHVQALEKHGGKSGDWTAAINE